MRNITFKKDDIIKRDKKKWQCIVCDKYHAGFAKYTQLTPDRVEIDFNEVFIVPNGIEQHFDFEIIMPNLGNEN